MIKTFLLKTVPLCCLLFLSISLASRAHAGKTGTAENSGIPPGQWQRCLVKLMTGGVSITVAATNCDEVTRLVIHAAPSTGLRIFPPAPFEMNSYDRLF